MEESATAAVPPSVFDRVKAYAKQALDQKTSRAAEPRPLLSLSSSAGQVAQLCIDLRQLSRDVFVAVDRLRAEAPAARAEATDDDAALGAELREYAALVRDAELGVEECRRWRASLSTFKLVDESEVENALGCKRPAEGAPPEELQRWTEARLRHEKERRGKLIAEHTAKAAELNQLQAGDLSAKRLVALSGHQYAAVRDSCAKLNESLALLPPAGAPDVVAVAKLDLPLANLRSQLSAFVAVWLPEGVPASVKVVPASSSERPPLQLHRQEDGEPFVLDRPHVVFEISGIALSFWLVRSVDRASEFIVTSVDSAPRCVHTGDVLLHSLFHGHAGSTVATFTVTGQAPKPAKSTLSAGQVLHSGVYRAYRWAQWMAGLDDSDSGGAFEKSGFRDVVDLVREVGLRIYQRIRDNQGLFVQLEILGRRVVPPAGLRAVPRPSTSLHDFVPGPASDDIATKRFKASFRRDTALVDAAIEITPAYPQQPPRWTLSRPRSSSGIILSPGIDNSLRAIEADVNTSFLSGDSDTLFQQIRMVQFFLDALLEFEATTTAATTAAAKTKAPPSIATTTLSVTPSVTRIGRDRRIVLSISTITAWH
jgi:hypothetical protein